MKLEIYTDGSCTPNPGKGTGAFIVVEQDLITDEKKILYESSFREATTTNNRMEITAVINAIQWCEENTTAEDYISIFIDSSYVQQGINSWMAKWHSNGFKRREKNQLVPIPNADLWQLLYSLVNQNIYIKYEKVKGHADNIWNNHVDKLCRLSY